MLTQAKEVVDAWRASQRTLDIKVLVNGTTYTARDINSLKYDSGAYTGETFAIGSTYSNSVQIEFSHLVEGLKLGMKVLPSIGIKTASGYVYEPLGVFVISNEIKMDRNNNLTTISASDQFCGLEGMYESSLSYPAKVLDVIAEVCAKAGVKVNTGDLARLPKQSDLPTPITGQSYRKALGWIAQLYVGYALFDRQGLFTIRTIAEPNYELDPSQYEQAGLVKNEATYKIGGIQCQTTITTETRDGEKTETTQTYQAGSSSGAQIKLENNIMTVERLNDIWERLKDLNFYPFSLNWFGNPAIEAGDWLKLKDKQGNSFVVPNNSYTLDFNGGLSAVSKADQTSSSAQAIGWSGSVMQAIKELQVRNAPDGTVIYPTTVTSPPENAKVNDIWFKKNGNDTELWVYEKQDDGSGVWKRNDLANDEIKKQIEEQQTALEEARSKADQAYHSAENAHLTADTIYKDFMSVQTDMSTQIADASQKAQETADNYAKMKHQVDSDLNALTKVTDNLTSNVGKLTTDVNGVKGQYATLDGRISEFSAGLEGINAQLKDAKGQLATVKLTADSAATNFSSAKGDIASLKTKANEIEQQMLSKVGNDLFESFRSSTAQALRSKLTASDLNGYARSSEVEQTANGLRASIVSVDDKIDNLKLGGRNYLQGSLNFKWPEGVGQENVTPAFETQGDAIVAHLSSQSNGGIYTKWKKAFPNGELQVGDDYTLSFDAKGSGVFKTVKNESEAGDGSLSGTSLTSNWKRYSVSGKINSLNKAYVIYFNGGYDADIKRVKIEKGNKPTDYTQAPEDIAKQLSKVDDTLKSQSLDLKVLKDGMQLRINEINNVNDRFNNLMIGGTNLLDRTSSEARSNDAPTTGWIEGAAYNTLDALTESRYVLSFEARGDVNGQRIGTFLWHGGLGGRNISKKSTTSQGETFTAGDGQSFVTLTTQWQRYWVLYEVDPDNTRKTAIVGRRWADSKPNGKVYVRKVKLESGDKATDWSPAPEDTANQLLNVGNTLKTYQTELNVLKDGMTLRTSEIARVNDRIDKLGIQNLVYNSEFINNAEGWSNIGNNPAGTILFANNEWDSWQGSNGLAFRNPSAPTSTLLSQSKRFKVLNWQRISASVQLHVTDNITNSCDAGMEIVFYPDEASGNEIKRVSQVTSRVNNISNGFAKLLYVNDVEVPANAKFATLRLWTYRVGNIIFNQPMVTFNSSYLPYARDNKSLGVLSEKYAALDVKVNGINSVVANKADVSYVDQRANQWKLELTGLVIGGTNLVPLTNQGVRDLYVENKFGQMSYTEKRIYGVRGININNTSPAPSNGWFVIGKNVTLSKFKPDTDYVISFNLRGDTSIRAYAMIDIRGTNAQNSISVGDPGYNLNLEAGRICKIEKKIHTATSFTDVGQVLYINCIELSRVRNLELWDLKIEQGNKATAWSPAPEDNMAAITAVRNELNTAINLRVQKGELLSQINMQAGHTLIQANKIYLDADSVVFSGKAFIPSAAIASLSADKINGGTINGRNVNVINLNANNITSGSINGKNLRIDLDNGAIQFQKGAISKADNSFVINVETGEISSNDVNGAKLYVNKGTLESTNGNNEGIFMANGSIILSAKDFWNKFDEKSTAEKYGKIEINSNLFESGIKGMDINSSKAITLRTDNFYLGSLWLRPGTVREVKGSGVALNKDNALIGSEGVVSIFGGKYKTSNVLDGHPEILVGTDFSLNGSATGGTPGKNIFLNATNILVCANNYDNYIALADDYASISSPKTAIKSSQVLISTDSTINSYGNHSAEYLSEYKGLGRIGSSLSMEKGKNLFLKSENAVVIVGGKSAMADLTLNNYPPHISIGAYDWAKDFSVPVSNSSINMVGWNINAFAFHENINLKTRSDKGVHVMGGGMTVDNGLQVHDLHVLGWLGVDGSKNSIVDTSQGKTAINAYETAEYYFGDIAKANTGTSKRIKILIDPLFLETINTSIDYHVFVSSYGDGYAWISEMKEDYFVIESNVPNLTVSYEIKAKRKQYENVRLDKVDVDLKGENK